MKNNNIINPVPGVFTFITSDGNDLRNLAATLNDQWSFYMVKRVGDDGQLAELEKTAEDINRSGVDRGTMAALESMNITPLNDHFPVNSYTLKRSRTNQKVALEEVKRSILTIAKDILDRFIKWVGDFLKGIPKLFKRKGKDSAAAEESAKRNFAKYKVLESTYRLRDKSDLEADEDHVERATAIKEGFTKYIDILSSDGRFIDSFRGAVSEIPNVVKYMDTTAQAISRINSDIFSREWSGDTEALISSVKDINPGKIGDFMKLFGNADSIQGAIDVSMEGLWEYAEEVVTFDPYNFEDIKHRIEFLNKEITPSTSAYFIDPSATQEMIESINLVDNVLGQIKNTLHNHVNILDRDRIDVVRGVVEKLTTAMNLAQFVGSLSVQFFDKSDDVLKKLFVYLHKSSVKIEE